MTAERQKGREEYRNIVRILNGKIRGEKEEKLSDEPGFLI